MSHIILTTREQEEIAFWQQSENFFIDQLTTEIQRLDGQLLDPKYQYYLQTSGKSSIENRYQVLKDLFLNPDECMAFRQQMARVWSFKAKPSRRPVGRQDVSIQGPDSEPLDLRIYQCEHLKDKSCPVLLYFHGGGGLYGMLDSMDGALTLLADEAELLIVSVNYRLAPEHPFPAANQDALCAFEWVCQNIADYGGCQNNIAIAGDSFGGYLSLATTLQQIESGGQIPSAMLLYYPVVDMDYNKYRSCQLSGENYDLDVDFMRLMEDLVFSGEPTADARLRPMESEYLSRLPKSLVVTAGFDLLRDQARELCAQANQQQETLIYRNYSSLIHGFLEYSGVIDAAEFACLDSARRFSDIVYNR